MTDHRDLPFADDEAKMTPEERAQLRAWDAQDAAEQRVALQAIADDFEYETGRAIDLDKLIEYINTGRETRLAPGLVMPARSYAEPVPPAEPAVPGWSAERQRAFIEHLSTHGCVTLAAREVGLSKQSAYQLRDKRPRGMFTLAWDVAIHRSRRLLLDEATERALVGSEVPVYRQGEQVGTRIVHNDRLLMFLLGLKRGPIHSRLGEQEVAELWPMMLTQIDADLPAVMDNERMAAMVDEDEDR